MRRLSLSFGILCSATAAAFAADGELPICFTGDTRAYLEVCGCQEGQLGGVARRGALLTRLRADDPSLVMVDAGGFFEAGEERDKPRMQTYAEALGELGYDAINVSSSDFSYGAEFLYDAARPFSLPLISSNLKAGAASVPILPHRILQRGEWRLGILGVAPEDGSLFDAPLTRLRQQIESMGPVDFTIILSALGRQRNRELAQQLPTVDLIVGHHGPDETRIGQAKLVSARSKGTHVGRIDLRGSSAVGLHAGEVMQFPVGAVLPVLSTVQHIIDEFYRSASAPHADQDPRVGPENGLESKPDLTYAGVESCAPCHRREYDDWSASLHAVAYATLQQRNRQFFADCVSCHTTGFGYESGFQIGNRSPMLDGVQCEVCHGPGSRHISRPLATNIRREVGPRFCQQCHTPEMSPEFSTHDEEFVGKINHRRSIPYSGEERPKRWANRTDPVVLDLFVMSLCPYGMRAESLLLPLAEQLKNHLRLNLHFIADLAAEPGVLSERVSSIGSPASNRQGCEKSTSSGDGPFLSLHGQNEIDESRRQLVLRSEARANFIPYVLCRSNQGPAGDWAACAEALGIDGEALEQAANGPEGERLLRENIGMANQLGVNVSPTVHLDGTEYEGSLEPMSLLRYLCAEGVDASLCQQIPDCGTDADCPHRAGFVALCSDPNSSNAQCEYLEPADFTLTVLNSDACRQCDTGDFLRSTMKLFPQVDVKNVSGDDVEGEKLVKQYGVTMFPTYILSNAFSSSPRFPRLRRMVDQVGGDFVVNSRISQKSVWFLRPRHVDRIDVFLPFGEFPADLEFVDAFAQEGVDLKIQYVVPPSLPAEDREELERRAVLNLSQPNRFTLYLRASNKALAQAATYDWRQAAAAAQIEATSLVEDTGDGTGLLLLEQGQAKRDSLDIAPNDLAVLLDNQLLVRNISALKAAEIWRERGLN